MKLTNEQRAEFAKVCRPVIEFLNRNCHPHVQVTIETSRAELSEGICTFNTEDYIKG